MAQSNRKLEKVERTNTEFDHKRFWELNELEKHPTQLKEKRLAKSYTRRVITRGILLGTTAVFLGI